jgi:hypothetical protein
MAPQRVSPATLALTHNFVCPKCGEQSNYGAPEGWSEQSCPNCKQPFRYLLATVRAKRSRGNKKIAERSNSIRVRYGGIEDLIEFTSDYGQDFEMKSGDVSPSSTDQTNACILSKTSRCADTPVSATSPGFGCLSSLQTSPWASFSTATASDSSIRIAKTQPQALPCERKACISINATPSLRVEGPKCLYGKVEAMRDLR